MNLRVYHIICEFKLVQLKGTYISYMFKILIINSFHGFFQNQ